MFVWYCNQGKQYIHSASLAGQLVADSSFHQEINLVVFSMVQLTSPKGKPKSKTSPDSQRFDRTNSIAQHLKRSPISLVIVSTRRINNWFNSAPRRDHLSCWIFFFWNIFTTSLCSKDHETYFTIPWSYSPHLIAWPRRIQRPTSDITAFIYILFFSSCKVRAAYTHRSQKSQQSFLPFAKFDFISVLSTKLGNKKKLNSSPIKQEYLGPLSMSDTGSEVNTWGKNMKKLLSTSFPAILIIMTLHVVSCWPHKLWIAVPAQWAQSASVICYSDDDDDDNDHNNSNNNNNNNNNNNDNNNNLKD